MVLKVLGGVQEKNGSGLAPDRVITLEVMKSLMTKIEDRLSGGSLNESFRRRLVMAGAYFAITYFNSLRGPAKDF